MISLEPFFFGSLPDYFFHRDSYKILPLDGDSPFDATFDDTFQVNAGSVSYEGFLQRFTTTLQREMETFLGPIQGLPNLVNPKLSNESHLSFLAGIYGYPPSVFNLDPKYRKMLSIIHNIKFRRGTLKAVEDYFKAIGLIIELTPIEPDGYFYDQAYYDGAFYDQQCNLCRYYDFALTDPNGDFLFFAEDPVPVWAVENLIKIFEYLLPVNAFIRQGTYEGDVIVDPDWVLRKYTDSIEDLRISSANVIRRV